MFDVDNMEYRKHHLTQDSPSSFTIGDSEYSNLTQVMWSVCAEVSTNGTKTDLIEGRTTFDPIAYGRRT